MEYVLGIDQGGTVTKAAIYDMRGNEVALRRVDTQVISLKPGFAEIDTGKMRDSLFTVIKNVIQESGIHNEAIKGIACCGHGKGLYLVDDKGVSVRKGILSSDTRAIDYPNIFEKRGKSEQIYSKTFQSIVPSQPVCLLSWLKDNEPNCIQNIRWVFSCKDYMRFLLTGEAYGEISDYSGSNLVNLHTKSYDRDLLKDFELEEFFDTLPPLISSTDRCGSITKQVAELTLLKEGTPVFGGMFDINACAIATGVVDPSSACIIAGTWSINEYLSTEPVTEHKVMMNSIFCDNKHYLIEESSATSAVNLAWYIKTFLPEVKKLSKDSNIYQITDTWVEEVSEETNYPFFIPFIMASNVNQKAKASFIGLTYFHNRKHITKSIYEGVAFSHMYHFEKLKNSREKKFDAIKISGGVTNSEIWLKIFADVLGEDITVVDSQETGALGCAINVAVGLGVYGSYQEACEVMVKTKKIIKTDETKHKFYKNRYAKYCSLLDVLDSWWQ